MGKVNSIVVDGLIKVKVERIGEDTYLSQIVDLVQNVDKTRIYEKNRLGKPYKIFMVSVFLASLLTLVIHILLGSSVYQSFMSTTTVMLIASNASLVLARPIAVVFAIITLTKKGIIVKNPRSIEMLPEIKMFVFSTYV